MKNIILSPEILALIDARTLHTREDLVKEIFESIKIHKFLEYFLDKNSPSPLTSSYNNKFAMFNAICVFEACVLQSNTLGEVRATVLAALYKNAMHKDYVFGPANIKNACDFFKEAVLFVNNKKIFDEDYVQFIIELIKSTKEPLPVRKPKCPFQKNLRDLSSYSIYMSNDDFINHMRGMYAQTLTKSIVSPIDFVNNTIYKLHCVKWVTQSAYVKSILLNATHLIKEKEKILLVDEPHLKEMYYNAVI